MAEVRPVNSTEFDDVVLKSELLTLVDFWAEWCGPCKMVAPVVEAIAKKYDGQLSAVKVNVDENQDLASRYGIRSIPTLLFFRGGELVETIVGFKPEDALAGTVDKLLGK